MTVQPINTQDGSMNVTAGQTYVTVAASSTTTALKTSAGRSGDWLGGLLLIPSSLTTGAVTIADSATGSSITVFAGGASSLSNLVPFFVPVSARSSTGGWFVTTGSSVTAIATGNFS